MVNSQNDKSLKRGRFGNAKNNPAPEKITGTIRVNGRGDGSIILPDGRVPQIATPDLNTAFDGDTVEISITGKGKEPAAKVEKVLARKRLEFVGVLEAADDVYFVTPEDRRMYVDILVPPDKILSAQSGDKVLVKIIKFDDRKKDPLGEVIQVLGRPGENEVEMLSIVLEKGFRPPFTDQVEAEAAKAKQFALDHFDEELAKRRDFRAVPTFTIDPIDAKDYDDALSLQKLPNGNFEVGIHIADVSFFVRPGTALDDEARARATSIYLVDRTIPMLPEVLSNDQCSLVEGIDRFAFSAVFELSPDGEIKDDWFGRTVINSNKRFSYEQVQTILNDKTGEYFDELETLNRLAYKLREKKIEAGALSFEDEEIKFKLDETGKPISVGKKERTDSHKLVEDFMLLANKKVAEFASKKNKNRANTFVYRIHDAPDPEKMRALQDFLKPLGYNIEIKGKRISSAELNRLLAASIGQPEENIIQRATVRTMQKAVYSMLNIGHYGLAFEHYTHFTSPIRRYPDLMVHRLLAIYLSGKQPSFEMLADYAGLAIHCSEREKQAAEAERDSVKYKQVEYMQDKIGQEFNGIVSGVTEWGIYVEELETKAEGMIRLADLPGDYYVLDDKNFAVVGERTKKRFRLGDLIRFKVKKTDLNRKILDFIPV
jgi:ribonuclease R